MPSSIRHREVVLERRRRKRQARGIMRLLYVRCIDDLNLPHIVFRSSQSGIHSASVAGYDAEIGERDERIGTLVSEDLESC